MVLSAASGETYAAGPRTTVVTLNLVLSYVSTSTNHPLCSYFLPLSRISVCTVKSGSNSHLTKDATLNLTAYSYY